MKAWGWIFIIALFVYVNAAIAVFAKDPVTIGNDRGGLLHERMAEFEALKGARVEITGRVCYSTCTMLLGLPEVCVSPRTVFGFHGPSRNGKTLHAAQFDYFSAVMASYYPAPLADWFMRKGRHKVRGVHKVTGAWFIERGIASAC